MHRIEVICFPPTYFVCLFQVSQDQVKCLICGKLYEYHGSMSNAKDHCAKKHPNDPAYKAFLASIRPPPQAPVPILRQKKLTEPTKPKYEATSPAQLSRERALVEMMIFHQLSPTLLGSAYGRKFFEVFDPRFRVPSRSTFLTRLVPIMASDVVDSIKARLSAAREVSVTLDAWKKNSQSLICVNIHSIVEVEGSAGFRHETDAIALDNLGKSHSAVNMKAWLDAKLLEFMSPAAVDRISSISSDNASNMVKLGESYNCPWIGCAIHLLQLVLMRDCKLLSIGVVKRARDLVSSMKRNSAIASALRKNRISLTLDCATRWNSTFHLLQTLYSKRHEVAALLVDVGDLIPLTTGEYTQIQILIELTKPFYDATLLLSKANMTTLSAVFVFAKKIHDFAIRSIGLASTYESKFPNFLEFASAMETGMRTRFAGVLSATSMYAQAAFLDIRYKTSFPDIFSATAAAVEVSAASLHTVPDLPAQEPLVTNTGLLVCDLTSPTPAACQPVASTIHAELESYKLLRATASNQIEVDPLVFWNQLRETYPRLTALALHLFVRQGTTVSVERRFSMANDLFTKKRNRLNNTTLQNLFLIHTSLSKNKTDELFPLDDSDLNEVLSDAEDDDDEDNAQEELGDLELGKLFLD
jgi:hypothetical protein